LPPQSTADLINKVDAEKVQDQTAHDVVGKGPAYVSALSISPPIGNTQINSPFGRHGREIALVRLGRLDAQRSCPQGESHPSSATMPPLPFLWIGISHPERRGVRYLLLTGQDELPHRRGEPGQERIKRLSPHHQSATPCSLSFFFSISSRVSSRRRRERT
jgi:hypothetical protein